MKRFATLALAAIFALSFTANVAAAPEFSGKFTVENEIDLNADAINVAGDGADLTFSLGAGEEGIWSLKVKLGSAVTDGPTTGYYNGTAFMTETAKGISGDTYYKDIDSYWYRENVKLDTDAEKALAQRDIARGEAWEPYAPSP